MFILATATIAKTAELSTDMKEGIVIQRDSEDPGKDCKAISNPRGGPLSTARDILKTVKEQLTVTHLKGRGLEAQDLPSVCSWSTQ